MTDAASIASAPTAAVLVIGDEILSGRTQDTNTNTIARFLAALGIDLMEARVVSDDHGRIVEALDALRSRWDYVFTTGGIGPTHDDITADAVAAAFGWPCLNIPRRLPSCRAAMATSSTPRAVAWRASPRAAF